MTDYLTDQEDWEKKNKEYNPSDDDLRNWWRSRSSFGNFNPFDNSGNFTNESVRYTLLNKYRQANLLFSNPGISPNQQAQNQQASDDAAYDAISQRFGFDRWNPNYLRIYKQMREEALNQANNSMRLPNESVYDKLPDYLRMDPAKLEWYMRYRKKYASGSAPEDTVPEDETETQAIQYGSNYDPYKDYRRGQTMTMGAGR